MCIPSEASKDANGESAWVHAAKHVHHPRGYAVRWQRCSLAESGFRAGRKGQCYRSRQQSAVRGGVTL